ncbi:uncharacterized protein LOC123223632 isoform X2 [Mangifera indica]|uniref:uncharacterized protein LOC123223632 isoform X2 n=1 Tax=Mangifera indica TaxID=29780 RepID=UPI001CFB3823|nr:uncharacterized protein LOC123223632 isoform X2 [Mangifera indica]
MREGLRSGKRSVQVQKDKVLPEEEVEVNYDNLKRSYGSGSVKELIKLEEGGGSENGECGKDGLTIGEGDGSEKVECGEEGLKIEEGDKSKKVECGEEGLKIEEGDGSEKVECGEEGLKIEEGDGSEKVECGEEGLKIKEGDANMKMKVEECNKSHDGEVWKKVKGRRGRPSKLRKSEESVGCVVRKKVKGKRGRPPKVKESDEIYHEEVKKKVKGKRGRPPNIQSSDDSNDDKARKKVKRGRPPKLHDSDEAKGERRNKSEFKCDGDERMVMKDKCGRPHKMAYDSEEAYGEGRKCLKRKRGRPRKDHANYTVLKPKFGKGRKVNGFRKSRRVPEQRDNGKGLNEKRFAPSKCETEDSEALSRLTSEAVRVLKAEGQSEKKRAEAKQEEALVRSEAKQLIRDQIVRLLFAAGWTIEYRPRNGREYKDAVYVNPEGKTHWSVTKAYKSLKFSYEQGDHNARSSFTFTPIPEDELKILERKTQKTRSDKNKRRWQKKANDEDTDGDTVTTKNKKKLKLSRAKLSSADSSGGKSLKRGIKRKSSLCEDNLVVLSHKGTPMTARKRKQQEPKNRKRCALLARNTVEGLESDSDSYLLYEGKRTVLAWMVELGTVPLNGKVQYLNPRKTRQILEGKITKDGIHCDCCDEILSIPKFEAHASSKPCYPFQNLYLESGTSLLQCMQDSWNKQEESKCKGFHFVDFGGEDPNDDTCGICGDGGDLICCDGCPSTFHQNCLDIIKFPSGKWHCVYCSCKFCGRIDDNTCQMDDKDSAVPALLICSLCEEKYHPSCCQADDATNDDPSSLSFCGKKCQKIFLRLENLLGVKHELEDGYTCTLIHRSDVGSDLVCTDVCKKVECNAKLAVALFVMDECFLPLPDHKSGVNLIQNIVYNFGSNFKRLNYSSFYTAILERDDEIISAASIRIHGNELAEMPFIGTRHMYRRQGMCRRLLNGIESVLCSLHVEKLVIPAISQLTETWTSVFGFKPLEVSSKHKMKNMNLLVFPGVDLLQKPMLKHHFIGKSMVPVEGVKSEELKKHQTVDEMAHNSDGKRLYLIDLNVCSEDTELDESVIGSTLQFPDGLSCDTSNVMSETVNLPESTTDTQCIDQLGVIHNVVKGNDKSVISPLGSASDFRQTEVPSDHGKCPDASALTTEGSASDVQIENSIIKHISSCDEALASDASKSIEHQDLNILQRLKPSSENVVAHDSEATNHVDLNAKFINGPQQSLVTSESGERTVDTDVVKSNLAVSLDPSTASVDLYRASTRSSCTNLLQKSSNIPSCSINQASSPTSQILQNLDNSSSFVENSIADDSQMNTKSTMHPGADSQVIHSTVTHCNSEALCNLSPGSGVGVNCASGGGNSCGTPEK